MGTLGKQPALWGLSVLSPQHIKPNVGVTTPALSPGLGVMTALPLPRHTSLGHRGPRSPALPYRLGTGLS